MPTEELEDDSLMPFGKYKGKQMQEVPANYFHWLWNNGLKNDKNSPVHKYIVKTYEALKGENGDLIWDAKELFKD